MAGIYFYGRQLIKPGAAVHINAESLVRSSTTAVDVVAVIGECKGGEPNVVLKFTDPATARQTLKDGDLLTAIELLYNPATDSVKFPGAYKIIAIRVDPAEKATGSLKDIGSVDIISLASKDWGDDQNQIRYKVEDGTVNARFEGVNGKKLTINDYLNDVYEIGDNLGPILKIKYAGNASTALLELSNTTRHLTVTLAGDQTDGSENLDIDLTKAAYNNVVKVVNYINSFAPFYEAEVLSNNNAFPSSYIDSLSSTTCKGVFKVLTSIWGAILDYIQSNSNLIDAGSISTGTVNSPANVSYTFLTGGTDGTTTSTHWQDALDLLLGEKVSIVIPVCTNDTLRAYVRQMTKSHVDYATGVSKYRTAVVGHSITDENDNTLETIKAISRSINDPLVVLASPGIKRYDRTGALVELESVFTGCCYAGMAIGSPEEPITFDFINAYALTKNYTESQIIDLLQAGVAPVEFIEDQGLRIVQGLTTYLDEDNPYYKEWWMQREGQIVSMDMQVALEKGYVGKGGYVQRVKNVKNTIITKCNNYIADGFIYTYDPQSIQIVFRDQWIRASVKVSFTDPINWVTLEINAVPATITV